MDVHILVFACLVSGFPCVCCRTTAPSTWRKEAEKTPSDSLLKSCFVFLFLPLCCWPIFCLHLSSPGQSRQKRSPSNSSLCFRNDQQKPHLTTDQVLPACILLSDRPLQRSSSNHFLFCLLLSSCMNHRDSLGRRTVEWNGESSDPEARQTVVLILLIGNLGVCVIF